jgi:hypothetical protein
MNSPSQVDPDKIAAYLATDYEVAWADRRFVLRIGQVSAELRALYAETGCATALFVTAFNPEGRSRPDAENAAAHESLRADLAGLGMRFAEGVGRAQAGDWMPEKSFLVLGIDRAAASSLGRRYGQDAVVWAAADAIPDLLVLR